MHSEPKSLSRTGGIPEESRRGPEPERGDAETRMRSPSLSRRFVIGSLVAFGILVANAFVTYRTIANLIEASRMAENTLKVVEVLKDAQNDVADSQIELRGYIISGERDRLERARGFLERAAKPIETLGALSGAIPDQTRQIELLGARIGEELARFDTLIEMHRRNGVAATIRNIGAAAGPATIHRVELLTAELLGAAEGRLARRTEQSSRSSDLSVITAAVATLFNLGLLGLVILLARREIKERRQAEEVVRFAATHDPLTGLPNRLLLAERANRALASAKSEGRGVGLLFIDLDRFKNINDALGHEAGDRLLQNVAGRVARCVRRS
ncbi:MAG TPA: diguanylate cyclase, partial [Burkholderiales bacterium]|nr:diguanylate cyclase [Burkholderiales bacterium]